MASNTPNLNLYKKDPTIDGNDTFNIKTMLNNNWDKLDDAVTTKVDKVDFSSHLADNVAHLTSAEHTNVINHLTDTTKHPIISATLNNADGRPDGTIIYYTGA